MNSILVAFLLLQARQPSDLAQIRSFLGATFRSAIQMLDAKNQALLRNVGTLAPAQAAELRARMQPPASLPGGARPTVALTLTGIGQGLVSDLFEGDFVTEQVNLLFCRDPERVIAVQVLLDDRQSLGGTVDLFRKIYGLPAPAVFAQYQPAMKYDLPGVGYDAEGKWQLQPGALPVTVWDLGMVEAVYQPVKGQRLVTGQLWIAEKAPAKSCPVEGQQE